MKKTLFILLVIPYISFSQSYVYYILNEPTKTVFIGYTDNFSSEESKHTSGQITETKSWYNIHLEKFEKFEDKFEASYFLKTFSDRVQKARGWTYLSSKNFETINSLLDDLNRTSKSSIKGSQIGKSNTVGKIAEQTFKEILQEENPKSEIVEQICLENSKGRTFIDLAYRNVEGELILVEIKSSQKAFNNYYNNDSKQQWEVHQMINGYGAKVCSTDSNKNSKIGITYGENIGPTKFKIGYFQ
jgi:predicted GIY-YIG superfamily endonuclease